jgi:hypothetical protein
MKSAIGSLSTEEEDALDITAASTIAGYETTWRWVDDERRGEVAMDLRFGSPARRLKSLQCEQHHSTERSL